MTSEERRLRTIQICGWNKPSTIPCPNVYLKITLDGIQDEFEAYRCPVDSKIFRWFSNKQMVQQKITHWKYNYPRFSPQDHIKLNTYNELNNK